MACQVARNNVGRLLGQGQYGRAYLTYVGGVEYVLKAQPLYDSEGGLRVTAVVEAVILSSVSHPNIIALVDVCISDNQLFLLEEVGGETLEQVVESDRQEQPYFRSIVSRQVSCAVAFLHQQRIYHNDLHTDNVVVNDRGRAKVIDFGQATLDRPLNGDDSGDYDWQVHGFARVEVRDCPRGQVAVATPPSAAAVAPEEEKYQELVAAVRADDPQVNYYDNALDLLAASPLEDTTTNFLASCYLCSILYSRYSSVTGFARTADVGNEELVATAVELATSLRWKLLTRR